MGARFAPFSFGGLLLQSYRPHLTQANRTHRTGIPSTSNLVDSMNTLFVNNEKKKLRCVQMMVRLVAEKRLGEETHKVKKNPWVFIHGIKKTLENVVFSRVCGKKREF